ncbi:hypothetical protein JCM11491_005822 [Sporobolomyces phaffii]
MQVPPTALHLAASLTFPITVHRVHAPPGADVQKTQSLLTYSYLAPRPDPDGTRDRVVETWDSPVHGTVVEWDVTEGQVVHDATKPIVHIREPCTHDVQWDGMCAVCGKDLTAVDYTGFSDTARATISMVHDVGGLTVSLSEAHRLESATTQRLLKDRKLSLIVDLDQTIVHATVDPTVGEWLKDPTNPNYGALAGVGRFKLGDEVGPKRAKKKKHKKPPPPPSFDGTGNGTDKGSEMETGTDQDEAAVERADEAGEDEEEGDEDGCWYYVKMRPGLASFLSRISEIYEMHVYTMGTRAYAIEVCKVIDPTGALFGGRILSRDESGSMTRKSLQRLFPCDTNMVVIIDDRADVWDGSPNLVKVIPYEFFVGIGDINAAFLPKKKELVPPPVKAPDAAADSPSASSTSGGQDGSSPLPPPRERITTTPPTCPEGDDKPTLPLAPQHHETVTDLLVTPSPSAIVSPALSDSSVTLAHAHDIELQISDRPLQKIADQSHALHQHERSHSLHSHSKSPSPTANGAATATREGDLKVDEDDPAAAVAAGYHRTGGSTAPGTDKEEQHEAATVVVGDADEVDDDDEEIDEAVLKDDDVELDRVFDILSNVHKTFYREHDEAGASDVASIIPAMKRSTFAGTYLVFSGLVALGSRPEDSEYWKLAETFGAKCGTELRDRVTHLVANQAGTAKVHSARRNPKIEIVYPQWLLDSVAHWTRLPEAPYLLPDPNATSASASTTPPPRERAPSSPERPALSDGERDDNDDEDDVELEMGAIDWGEAMAEMDDLLNETDDDGTATDRERDDVDRDASSSSSNRNRTTRKRSRASVASTDDESDSGTAAASESSKKGNGGATATESPLQKRVKTARSRSSGLKTSLSAAALAASSDSETGSTPVPTTTATTATSKALQDVVVDAAIGRAESAEMSQTSSSISSDDEGFLASLEAELEAGFEGDEGDGDDDDDNNEE